MKNQPSPSDHEVLTGLVERVTYQNAENGFCVVRIKVRGQRELVTLVGHAAAISAGEWITATGNWINDRTHGQQFKARFLKTSEAGEENAAFGADHVGKQVDVRVPCRPTTSLLTRIPILT